MRPVSPPGSCLDTTAVWRSRSIPIFEDLKRIHCALVQTYHLVLSSGSGQPGLDTDSTWITRPSLVCIVNSLTKTIEVARN